MIAQCPPSSSRSSSSMSWMPPSSYAPFDDYNGSNDRARCHSFGERRDLVVVDSAQPDGPFPSQQAKLRNESDSFPVKPWMTLQTGTPHQAQPSPRRRASCMAALAQAGPARLLHVVGGSKSYVSGMPQRQHRPRRASCMAHFADVHATPAGTTLPVVVGSHAMSVSDRISCRTRRHSWQLNPCESTFSVKAHCEYSLDLHYEDELFSAKAAMEDCWHSEQRLQLLEQQQHRLPAKQQQQCMRQQRSIMMERQQQYGRIRQGRYSSAECYSHDGMPIAVGASDDGFQLQQQQVQLKLRLLHASDSDNCCDHALAYKTPYIAPCAGQQPPATIFKAKPVAAAAVAEAQLMECTSEGSMSSRIMCWRPGSSESAFSSDWSSGRSSSRSSSSSRWSFGATAMSRDGLPAAAAASAAVLTDKHMQAGLVRQAVPQLQLNGTDAEADAARPSAAATLLNLQDAHLPAADAQTIRIFPGSSALAAAAGGAADLAMGAGAAAGNDACNGNTSHEEHSGSLTLNPRDLYASQEEHTGSPTLYPRDLYASQEEHTGSLTLNPKDLSAALAAAQRVISMSDRHDSSIDMDVSLTCDSLIKEQQQRLAATNFLQLLERELQQLLQMQRWLVAALAAAKPGTSAAAACHAALASHEMVMQKALATKAALEYVAVDCGSGGSCCPHCCCHTCCCQR